MPKYIVYEINGIPHAESLDALLRGRPMRVGRVSREVAAYFQHERTDRWMEIETDTPEKAEEHAAKGVGFGQKVRSLLLAKNDDIDVLQREYDAAVSGDSDPHRVDRFPGFGRLFTKARP